MKVIQKDFLITNGHVDAFCEEIRVTKQCEGCKFLLPLKDIFTDNNKIYMIMELFEGGDIYLHLQKMKRFNEDQVKFMAAQIAMGIGHLHKDNFMHRDLKLENILVKNDGNVVLSDYSLSRSYDETRKLSFCGSPEYMTPEMLKNEKYDLMVDWWAYGVVLFELLYGKTPFFN